MKKTTGMNIMKWLLFALAAVYTLVCIIFAFVSAGSTWVIAFIEMALPLLTLFLLSAWWLSIPRSRGMSITLSVMAELGFLAQIIIMLYVAMTYMTSAAPDAGGITVSFIMLLAGLAEFILVCILQNRAVKGYSAGALTGCPAVRRNHVLQDIWLFLGVAGLVLWIVFMTVDAGSYWGYSLFYIPLYLLAVAFAASWWMSPYRGRGTEILFTVLMCLFAAGITAGAVYLAREYSNGALSVCLAGVTILWTIMYVVLEAVHYVQLAAARRKAA